MSFKNPHALSIVLLLASACMVSPYAGQTVDKNQPILFEFYMLSPNAPITIRCSNTSGVTDWSTTIRGGSTPFTFGGDTLYPTTARITLPPQCWSNFGSGDFTFIRPTQDSYSVATYTKEGLDDCLFKRIFQGESPISAGSACRTQGNAIRIDAR